MSGVCGTTCLFMYPYNVCGVWDYLSVHVPIYCLECVGLLVRSCNHILSGVCGTTCPFMYPYIIMSGVCGTTWPFMYPYTVWSVWDYLSVHVPINYNVWSVWDYLSVHVPIYCLECVRLLVRSCTHILSGVCGTTCLFMYPYTVWRV